MHIEKIISALEDISADHVRADGKVNDALLAAKQLQGQLHAVNAARGFSPGFGIDELPSYIKTSIREANDLRNENKRLYDVQEAWSNVCRILNEEAPELWGQYKGTGIQVVSTILRELIRGYYNLPEGFRPDEKVMEAANELRTRCNHLTEWQRYQNLAMAMTIINGTKIRGDETTKESFPRTQLAILRTYLSEEKVEDRVCRISADHNFALGPYQDTVGFPVGSNQTILSLEEYYNAPAA